VTSDERKTLEALTTDPVLPGDARGMVAAALAEVDRLTQQVATLNRDRALMHADRIIDAATIADLEARAIPKAWVDSLDNRTLWVSLESPGDGTRDVCVRYHGGVATIERVVGTDRMFLETRMPLSAALSAAKEAP